MDIKTQSKKCPKCGLTKSLEEFPKNKGTKSGLDYYCKACRASGWANKMSIPANREARNEYVRNWRRQNKGPHAIKKTEIIKIMKEAIGQMNRIGRALDWSDPVDEGYINVLLEMRGAVKRGGSEEDK